MRPHPSLPGEVYISVDVETGGPVPGAHSLLSLGACVVADLEETFYAELKPVPGTASLPEAVGVTGLDPGALAVSGTDPNQAAADFATWVGGHAADARPIFVAFNAPFDWPFVVRLFFEAGVENPFGHTALDVKAYYMALSGSTWDGTRSSQLPDEYALRPDREHHALSDAVAQARSFGKMLRDARALASRRR